MNNVESIGKLIGRPVVSMETANKLGHVNDLLIDPVTGLLEGLSVEKLDESCALVSSIDVHNIGPDAIMVEQDHSLVLVDASPLRDVPRVKANLTDVKVITEGGQLLGKISDAFLCLLTEPVFIYEVRNSIFDLLLGHAFYFPASLGCALSGDGSALVIRTETALLDHKLEAAAQRVFGSERVELPDKVRIQIEIRSHA